MKDKVINFNESKTRLISKKYPNIAKTINDNVETPYLESSLSLDKFLNVYEKYEKYVNGDKTVNEVKLDEVIYHFNKYFDVIYKIYIKHDDSKTPKFREILDYAMLSNGKRLRPFLIFLMYNLAGGDDYMLLAPFMVAIEMIHTYSLIHDDLPCMDNDTLRRGKETVWKKYGEDMAVLAGDALLTQASVILMEAVYELGYTEIGAQAVTSALILLKLAGLDGMIIGQVYDVMNTKNTSLSENDFLYMYNKKTAALIQSSLVIGASLAGGFEDKSKFVDMLGLAIGDAYQIQDDLLEIESTSDKIGKSVDSDKRNGKVTYVSKIGVDEAKRRLRVIDISITSLIEDLVTDKNQKTINVFREFIKYIMNRSK